MKEEYAKAGNVFLHAIHRIDRPVSGIVLFARTSKALSRLNNSLRDQLFQKEYLAVVEGEMSHTKGELEHYLERGEFATTVVTKETPGAKKCLLKYRVLKKKKGYSLLRISLLTGRYHQIRAQLSAFGYPILGDRKYGSKAPITHPPTPLFLHHSALSFPHPITHEKTLYEAATPPNWDLFCRIFS